MKVDRRTTLKWLAATMAATGAGCASTSRYVGDEIPPVGSGPLLGTARGADGVGIGVDPDLISPVVPWRRTMTQAQLDTAAALAEVILPADDRSPAASEVGVHEFIDEWVSAPYPQQQRDRESILAGLEQLERECREQFGVSFVGAAARQRERLVDALAVRSNSASGRDEFFARFRYLAVGAFYTTQAGIDEIGYLGNTPVAGDYPGLSEEAIVHLNEVLRALNLPGTRHRW